MIDDLADLLDNPQQLKTVAANAGYTPSQLRRAIEAAVQAQSMLRRAGVVELLKRSQANVPKLARALCERWDEDGPEVAAELAAVLMGCEDLPISSVRSHLATLAIADTVPPATSHKSATPGTTKRPMSARSQAILAALADGPLSYADLATATASRTQQVAATVGCLLRAGHLRIVDGLVELVATPAAEGEAS